MFSWIIAGWIAGMIGYTVLGRLNRYNNFHYYNVKKYEKRFKRIRDEVNGVEKNVFK
jgi:hypothetical protein